jgi:solute carrier family 45 protein 1/2/4
MAGFSPLAVDEGRDDDAQWAGISRIKGPQWTHLPTLTVGMLGSHVLGSVQVSYGAFNCP